MKLNPFGIREIKYDDTIKKGDFYPDTFSQIIRVLESNFGENINTSAYYYYTMCSSEIKNKDIKYVHHYSLKNCKDLIPGEDTVACVYIKTNNIIRISLHKYMFCPRRNYRPTQLLFRGMLSWSTS